MPYAQDTPSLSSDDSQLLPTYLELAQPKPDQRLLLFSVPDHPGLDFLINQGLQPESGMIGDGKLPYDDTSIDHILVIRPALLTDDAQGFVDEAARILKPGGTVAILAHAMPKNRKASRYVNALLRLYNPQHNWAYSLPRWSGIIKQAGLTKKQTVEHTPPHRLTDWLAAGTGEPDSALKLEIMLRQAPEKAQVWLNTAVNAAGDVTFALHSGLVLGQK